MSRLLISLAAVFLLAACAGPALRQDTDCTPAKRCPSPVTTEPAKPPEKPLQPADWSDIPGWQSDDPLPAFEVFRASCNAIESQPSWHGSCAAARAASVTSSASARAWFEAEFRPWALVNPDGTREGIVTGYYEPLLKGSRTRKPPYVSPLFSPPEDLVVVDLADVYPELKSLRLRGRLQGRKLVPYYTRAEWAQQEESRSNDALLWIDDPLDAFFMQIQGSGQVVLDDGSRIRVSYADQNGHPFRSIGKWLVEQGEIKLEQASMQGIKAWARSHPKRLQEMLNANPSLVFFRELPADGSGPPGALGVPLTPERSIAIDPRIVTLGAPVFVATTWPNDSKPLQRLMLAQDTGGAIRGVVRADFYWGSGNDAGSLAGRMRQKGSMWVLMPKTYSPK
jgi:membrane-bound lytic murein transglycosylase A